MITFCCKGGVTYLVAVAMHIAFASPTSGHFVAWSNQFPNCLIGSKDTSWLSSKHCEQNTQLNTNALGNTHSYWHNTAYVLAFRTCQRSFKVWNIWRAWTHSFLLQLYHIQYSEQQEQQHTVRDSTLTYIITTVQSNSQDGGFSWYAQEHFILTQVRKVTYVLISFVFLPHVTQVHGCAVTRWFPVEIQCKNPLLTRRQRGMWGRNCT